MPLQISEFKDVAYVRGSVAQLPDGMPYNVQNQTSGTITLGEDTRLVRIAPLGGSFNVTWPNGEVERFDAPEFRALAAGLVLTVAAVV